MSVLLELKTSIAASIFMSPCTEEVPVEEKKKVLTVKEKILAKLKEQKDKVEKNKALTDVVEAKERDRTPRKIRVKKAAVKSTSKKKPATRKKPEGKK